MRFSSSKRSHWAATAVVAISLISCQQAPRSGSLAAGDQNIPIETLPNADVKLAIEPFEVVTEQAFTATPDQLRALISKARASYKMVEPTLAPHQRNEANRYLAVLANVDRSADRSEIALASVELYRLFLEAQNRAGDPLVRAGLLDYAGFRYDALAQARNIDWAEMSRTTQSAKFEWIRLKPAIADKTLQGRFSNSLQSMSDAASKRDKVGARKAAAIELQLVDLLEKHATAKSG